MTLAASSSCPRCGAALPAGAPDALCPACLLSGAVAPADEATLPMEEAGRPRLASPASADRPPPQAHDHFPCAFGGYRLLGLLGRGGMGAVYEAEQLSTGRRVALKILEQEIDSPEMRQRFLREGRLAAGVSHPHSIYVFGTEEIDGQPVIAMEVAGGGTLKDRVKKRGPLPVAEAVDAILDVVAGLEAAHAGGVLHRDVKPSNCFVSPDGSVKVGDFGLSVSTLAVADTFLTASGAVLGTPAYAPPEQLRGDAMDLRADIYSVGATLYSLLTGKAPLEGENPVQVVAAVLDEKPKPVSELRPDVPAGLSQVVARCLAKKPEQRFAGYGALRDALLPYGSATPEAAPLGFRFLAGFVDEALASLPTWVLMVAFGAEPVARWLSERTPASAVPWTIASIIYVLYHAVPEALWGAAVGKAAFGLRVARPGGGVPGIARAMIRAVIAFAALECGVLVHLATTTAAEYRLSWAAGTFLPGDWVFFWVWWSLFLTMRRRNGFANLMDLASGTRVVLKPKAQPRPALTLEARLQASADAPAFGPYRFVKAIVPAEWIAAFDPALRRDVWLQRAATGTITQARRNLARPGRPRWLQSVERDNETWDAFEAPPGVPLSKFAAGEERPHWESVRHWLHDLAEELDAASRDGTLPERLSLDQVWITARGRALLLDEAWPEAAPGGPRESFAGRDVDGQQRFLNAVAAPADPVTVPLHARPVLRNLAAGSFEKLSFLAGTLRTLLAKPARIGRARRAASILAAPLLFLALFAVATLYMHGMEKTEAAHWTKKHPGLPALSDVLRYRIGLDPWRSPSGSPVADIHIAWHYRRLAEALGEPAGTDPGLPLSEDERQTLLAIFAAHPDVTAEEGERADRALGETLPEFLREERARRLIGIPMGAALFLPVMALVQLFTLTLFRNTPGQLLFGFAVVNKKGERAGRFRLFGRWLLTWVPLLFALFQLRDRVVHPGVPWHMLDYKMLIYAGFWLIGLGIALARPSQGLHDEWTKCWLVPR